MKGLIQFIREQGVVGLAVGFILAGAIQRVITSIVTDLINPVIGLMLGYAKELSSQYIAVGSAKILWGHFISTVIDFLIVTSVVYFIVHGLKLDKLDKKKESK